MGKKLTNVKQTIKNEMPKTRKGLILGLTFGIATPIALGVVGGIVYTKFFMAKTVDYSDVNSDSLYINIDNVRFPVRQTVSYKGRNICRSDWAVRYVCRVPQYVPDP